MESSSSAASADNFPPQTLISSPSSLDHQPFQSPSCPPPSDPPTFSKSSSSSSSSLDHQPFQSPSSPPPSDPPTFSKSSSSSPSSLDHQPCQSPSSPPPSDPATFSKSSSFSRLNAQAPEFVPRTSSFSSAASLSSLSSPSSSGSLLSVTHQQSDLPASFVIPRPPGPPALVHVYNTTTAPAATGGLYQVPPLDGQFGYGYRSPLPFYGGGMGGVLDRQLQQQDLPGLAAVPAAPSAQANSNASAAASLLNIGMPEETAQKLMKQVEFYFSDVNLATTGFLFKVMCKDPEGYVPISVVASIKKIKTLTKSHSQLASILRGSSKLVVSDDGKKVKRQNMLTESDMEEVQSRIIIAENLPEDHCHQNLMKIFSAVGSVKSIRTCQPSGPSVTSKAAKTDGVNFSNKLHAFVEYESSELAEKAVAELNEGNWRNGLKVRLLLRHSAKSAQARFKKVGHEVELNSKEEDMFAPEHQHINEFEDSMQLLNEPVLDEHTNDKLGGLRKGQSHASQENSESRSRGKGRGRPSYNVNNRGNHPVITSNISDHAEQPTVAKHPSGPRMPDGTRGFSMGRGKPLAVKIA